MAETTTKTDVFVAVQGLRKRYDHDGPFAVGPNGGVSFDIKQGEIFSLLGPNGAGKTTVISMMSTLLTPTEGDVVINGFSVQNDPINAKAQIGMVPQELALYPSLSARQNLEFFGRMYGLSGKDLKSRADEVLEFIGLTERADDKIDEYSGGMKRRVNIGVGLMHRPRMIFLDEPTVAIDPQSRRRILDTVKWLNEEGMTVLYTTHYMEEAQELSDRVGIIDHGEIIAMDTIDALTDQVGQKDTLIISVLEPSEDIIEDLKQIDGIDNAMLKDEEIHLMSDEGRRMLPRVIERLNEHNITMQSVEVREPNLEAVFLHLTGRALRD
jgi:ABC-2 type transport system ATP-binding protein